MIFVLPTKRNGRYLVIHDLLELLRADIDAASLPWVASQTWKRPDFPVTPEGIVRLTAPLAAVVAQRVADVIPARKLGASVEWTKEAITTQRKRRL
jgi:hypothetical protein